MVGFHLKVSLFFLSNCAYIVPKKLEGTNLIVKKIGSDLIKKKINENAE